MRRPGHDDGFTLVEMLVVVAIVAILIVIALPYFAHAREPAVDRQAQTLLTHGLEAVKVVFSDTENLAAVSEVELGQVEPALQFLASDAAAEAARREISVASGVAVGDGYVVLSTHTSTGDCLAVREAQGSATLYQRVAGGVCPANSFDPQFGWLDRWPPR